MAFPTPTRAKKFLSTLSLRRATGRRCIRSIVRLAFLSTLSLRRATLRRSASIWLDKYFYPRSPCGERPEVSKNSTAFSVFLSTLSLRRATTQSQIDARVIPISIHALLAESDTPRLSRVVPTPIFLSTLSLRRAT